MLQFYRNRTIHHLVNIQRILLHMVIYFGMYTLELLMMSRQRWVIKSQSAAANAPTHSQYTTIYYVIIITHTPVISSVNLDYIHTMMIVLIQLHPIHVYTPYVIVYGDMENCFPMHCVTSIIIALEGESGASNTRN